MVNFLVNGVNVKFRIDPIADITVIPNDILELLDGVNIMPLSQILTCPTTNFDLTSDALNVEGKFIAKSEAVRADCCSNQDTSVFTQ